MMKDFECPICWDKDVRQIDLVEVENQDIFRPLMFCELCEKYYWGDTNDTVTEISSFCEIFDLVPKSCYLKEENSNLSKETYLSKNKQQEFDLICGFCPNRLLHLKSGLRNIDRQVIQKKMA